MSNTPTFFMDDDSPLIQYEIAFKKEPKLLVAGTGTFGKSIDGSEAYVGVTETLDERIEWEPHVDEADKLDYIVAASSGVLAGLADDIEEATREQLSETPGFVDEALGLIAAAQEEITSHPEVSITAKAYDAARAELIKSLGGTPDSGQITWPPTSQTVSKRSNGYWNDALAQLGLRVRAGRQRGAAKFTDEDYLDTLRAFANWTERFGLKPTVAAYGRWLNEGFSGEARPSSAAIRQHFGTWRAALATVSQ